MPTTLLLAVHCKKSEEVDVKKPLKKYIISSYGAQVWRVQGLVLLRWLHASLVRGLSIWFRNSRHRPRSQAAEDAADDLQELQDLRNEIVNLSGSLQSLRSTLGKYYRALELVAARFPIGRGSDDVRIPFVWADAFK